LFGEFGSTIPEMAGCACAAGLPSMSPMTPKPEASADKNVVLAVIERIFFILF
jgi:hypothetical protein